MAKGKFSLNLDALERLFKARTPPVIGTDVSSSAIKMVEIMEAGKSMYRVERYAIEPLPKDSVVEGNINNIDAVSDALYHDRTATSRVWLRLPAVRLGQHAAEAFVNTERRERCLVSLGWERLGYYLSEAGLWPLGAQPWPSSY